MNENGARKGMLRRRISVGLSIIAFGMLVFVLGVDPGLYGMDRSPVLGFLQIAVFLVGLALICLGGYIVLNTLWIGSEKTIIADIGFRLVSTGYVICAVSGMADVFGLGNQPFPAIPYFGEWQAIGVIAGEMVIVLGFLMLIPYAQNAQVE